MYLALRASKVAAARWDRFERQTRVVHGRRGLYTSAVEATAESEDPVLPALPYTEADVRLALIFKHIRHGQIDPGSMRRLSRRDLEFIAANQPLQASGGALGSFNPRQMAHEAATIAGPNTKLMANVARAQLEIHRRDLRVSTGIAAGAGGALGGLVALVVGTAGQGPA